jgi:hypothetical protein
LANVANNVTINVSPCPKGCSKIPAVVFNTIATNNANVSAGEEWLELVSAIIGTQGTFGTPYQILGLTAKTPNYRPFYLFEFGSYMATDLPSTYWKGKDKILNQYTLTQQLNTIYNDLVNYYGPLP